jgi:tryptophan halogenase
MIRKVTVLGAGSAGLIAALTLRRLLPGLAVEIVRSPDIGVIGVGEGTTRAFPPFFFETLRLDPAELFAEAQPVWKLGIRFLWGPRERFFYTFSYQFDQRWPDLPRANGYYCEKDVENVDVWAALMAAGKAFPKAKDGRPIFARHQQAGFHIENRKLVGWLENACLSSGATFTDGTVASVDRDDEHVRALVLESGQRIDGDLFVDASGFRSELIGRAFDEPFLSFSDSLFCDRAIIGGWPRTSEPISAYTTAETMNAGWCWQIEHEHWINRGYVYASNFISDDDARAEFLGKNPGTVGEAREPRIVKFRSGRYARTWIGNVVGIGNSSGFVEPLEATALSVIIHESRSLAAALFESAFEPTPSIAALYNRTMARVWDEIRDFIAIHYRFNTRIATPFWQHCWHETPLKTAQPIADFYVENGPTSIHKTELIGLDNSFTAEGYLALLIGQRVPHRKPHRPSPGELQQWERYRARNASVAQHGYSVAETLAMIRSPGWRWQPGDAAP